MKWFLKVIKQYADFNGRARRKEYWMFTLIFMIIYYALTFLVIALEMPTLGILLAIFALGLLVPSIAVAVRRMHDVGKSGWYVLIPIYSFILAVTDSQPGPNEYGENPKGIGNDGGIEEIGKPVED